MGEERNHYKVLGVDENADTDKIKQAYRSAAMKYHPDFVGGDSETFRCAQEAYEVQSGRYHTDHMAGSLLLI